MKINLAEIGIQDHLIFDQYYVDNLEVGMFIEEADINNKWVKSKITRISEFYIWTNVMGGFERIKKTTLIKYHTLFRKSIVY